MDSIFLGLIDLIKFGQNLDLPFGFGNIKVSNRNLRVVFRDEFVHSIANKHFETTMKRSSSPVS